jgi:hypothetical protein
MVRHLRRLLQAGDNLTSLSTLTLASIYLPFPTDNITPSISKSSLSSSSSSSSLYYVNTVYTCRSMDCFSRSGVEEVSGRCGGLEWGVLWSWELFRFSSTIYLSNVESIPSSRYLLAAVAHTL